jgi:hypothetical protein
MNKYSPYWILNPLKNELNIRNHGNWNFYTSKEVIDGTSPLKELGNKFYQISHGHVSLYDHCLWIFNSSAFDSENSNKLARVLKSVSETFCNSSLSQTGIIVTHKNGSITKQPATPKHYDTTVEESITDEKLTRILNISESIFQDDLGEYLAIFEYLREIRKSKTFIRELALWSFIEQHWLQDINSKNKLAESLKELGTKVYGEKVCTESKSYVRFKEPYKLFKKNLSALINSIGGNKDKTSDLRNSLAHGTFFKQQKTWTEDQWNSFFNVHNFLWEMTLLGLEKEIIEARD